jgi:phage terminase small subunit
MAKKKLTEKQKKFIKEYPKDLNATQAAKRAGYSKHTAQEIGSENLSKPIIKEAIKKDVEKRLESAELDADWILKRIMDIADVDLAQAYDHIGQLKPVHEIPENVRKAITGIKVFDEMAGVGNEKFKIGEVREVKFADKLKALELLGKHIVLFTDKIEHTVNEKQLSDEELDRLIEEKKGKLE